MSNYGTCDMFEIKICDDFYTSDTSDTSDAKIDDGDEANLKNNAKRNRIVNVPYFKNIIEKIDIDKKLIYFKESCKDYL